MKRCTDPKYELVFPQFLRGLRNLLEKCFRGDVKDTFLHSSELETDLNNGLAFFWLLYVSFERL